MAKFCNNEAKTMRHHRSTQMMRAYSFLLVASVLLAAGLTPAAPSTPPAVVLHLAEGGGVEPGAAAEATTCSGIAPLQNSCRIVCDCTSLTFSVPPLVDGVPVSLAAYSALETATGSNGQSVAFACNVIGAAAGGSLAPSYRCALLHVGAPTLPVTIDIHIGLVDPSVVAGGAPSLNGIEAGVGPWAVSTQP